ncbi:gag-pol polyprotein [Tanacetum coccineum]
MRPFGCPVTILNTIDHLGKFDRKADEGFFVGYSTNSKAFRVFNSRTRIVEENMHVKFSEDTPNIAGSGPNWLFDIDALTKSMNYKPVVAENQSNGNADTKACDDAVVIQNTCSEKEDTNSDTTFSKSVKESSLDSATKDVHAIKYKMSKAKERCMEYFRPLHSHLHVLSKEDLKGTHIEHGFKRAFMSLFGQDHDTFTSTMFLNVDQLQKQLDKDDFQEDGSMEAFWYFVEYTRIEVKHFRDTLLQHMGNVKKSVDEKTLHQRQYDTRVNKRQMHTQESKIDTSKAVDADLIVTESSGTESEVQDDNSRSGNDIDADDTDIRPIYDEEPLAEVQLIAECNIFAIGQQHT